MLNVVPHPFSGNIRYYAVWHCDNHPEFRGIHWGIDTDAYYALIAAARTDRGGFKLKWTRRGCWSLDSAWDVYVKEATPNETIPENICVYCWSR